MLIENGAEINARDAKGQTPLFIASGTGQLRVAKVIVTPSTASFRNGPVSDTHRERGGCESGQR